MESKNPSCLSLCSGIGGLELSANWAGFMTVGFVEHDRFCQKVLAKNWPGVPIYDDLTSFDARPYRGVDLVTAGFPCQPHSLAGKRQASGDERDLWGHVARVVGEARPRWFVGENVPGLLSSESGQFFGRVLDDLAEMGYRVGWCVYGASDVGAVHRRRRVFIIAYSTGEQDERSSRQRVRPYSAAKAAPHANSPGWQEKKQSSPVKAQISALVGASFLGTGNWREWGISPAVKRRPSGFESEVRGQDDGFSRPMDGLRLKALGNAVCPQQAYPIFRAIRETLSES